MSDGEFLDAETVSLEPGEQTGLSFTLDTEEALTLQLKLDVEDDLTVDNVAFAGLTPLANGVGAGGDRWKHTAASGAQHSQGQQDLQC